MPTSPNLSPDACRAARAILRWSVADLVHSANVSPNSIQKVENGDQVRQSTIDRILNAFARAGVDVLDDGAQRRRQPERGSALATATLRH